jgi:hypothetical protein
MEVKALIFGVIITVAQYISYHIGKVHKKRELHNEMNKCINEEQLLDYVCNEFDLEI